MTNPDWTFEEARAENDKACALDPSRSFCDPTLPLFQWFGLQELRDLQAAFERGNKYALMTAVRICANHDLPLPLWAAKAFIRAYDTVTNAREKSWDAVFGAPYPKGTHLNAIRKRRMLKFAVWNRINDILGRAPETPIDGSLFEMVGTELNIGKTLAADYYYDAKRVFDRSNSAKS